MKISLTQENLLHTLQRVTHIAGRQTTLPILQHILLQVDTRGARFLGTNLEIGITATLRAKVEAEGVVTLPAKLFSDYVALLPSDRVDIEVEGQKTTIRCKNKTTTILGSNPEDFPLLPEFTSEETITLSTTALQEAIEHVLYASAPDETRPEIHGVLLSIEDTTATLVATDSYRLAEYTSPLKESVKKSVRVILPQRSMHELNRILGDAGETITVHVSKNQVMFTGEDFSLMTRVIDGQYPDYRQIIPTTHATRATLPTRELVNVIRTAGLFSSTNVADIHLHFKPNEQSIVVSSSSGQMGEQTATVAGEVIGEEQKVVFNWRYLLEGVEHMRTEQVTFDLVNATQPGIVRPKDGKRLTYLIMPIKQ